MSQERLSEALGLTFQQVQKYERAANRVSASKLYEIARALDVRPAYFFEGLPADEGEPPQLAISASQWAFIHSRDGMELADNFRKLKAGVRRKIIELVRAIVAADRAD